VTGSSLCPLLRSTKNRTSAMYILLLRSIYTCDGDECKDHSMQARTYFNVARSSMVLQWLL
jgi:hypothetical protein